MTTRPTEGSSRISGNTRVRSRLAAGVPLGMQSRRVRGSTRRLSSGAVDRSATEAMLVTESGPYLNDGNRMGHREIQFVGALLAAPCSSHGRSKQRPYDVPLPSPTHRPF